MGIVLIFGSAQPACDPLYSFIGRSVRLTEYKQVIGVSREISSTVPTNSKSSLAVINQDFVSELSIDEQHRGHIVDVVPFQDVCVTFSLCDNINHV